MRFQREPRPRLEEATQDAHSHSAGGCRTAEAERSGEAEQKSGGRSGRQVFSLCATAVSIMPESSPLEVTSIRRTIRVPGPGTTRNSPLTAAYRSRTTRLADPRGKRTLGTSLRSTPRLAQGGCSSDSSAAP